MASTPQRGSAALGAAEWIASDQPMRPMPTPLDRFDVSIQFLLEHGRRDRVEIRLALQWQAMGVFSGL